MIYRSWLTWGLMIYIFCTTIAKPATSNLAYHVPDNIKSIISFVTISMALWVTYKLSSLGDKEACEKVRKHYLILLTVVLIGDAIVIASNHLILRYAAECVLDKVVGPILGLMIVDARKKEAERLGTDLAGMYRRMEFPRCVAITIGGLIAIYLYQPGMGLSIQEGLWLQFGGGLLVDAAVINITFKKED